MCLIRLGDLTINKNLSTVVVDGKEVSLEPKLLELLSLFCQHSNQIIGRQQILDAIWPNSMVTDNAVNKLIASLRKVLKDDPKTPKYIQTVPKRGYRLIADVEHVQQPPEPLTASVKTAPIAAQNTSAIDVADRMIARSIKSKLTLLLVLSVIIIIAYTGLLWRPGPLEATSPQTLSPALKTLELTKMPGLERSPLMSSDQGFILYLREDLDTGHRSLWHKNLVDEQESLVAGISPYVSRLVSLKKEKAIWQLVYLVQEGSECYVALVELDDRRLSNKKTLFNCAGMRIFDLAWHSEANKLYYSAKAHHESVSRIYQFDVGTKTHSLVTQPEARGTGNRGIDISPDGQKLLIVHLDKDLNSGLHVLNLQNNSLTPGLFTQHNIETAVWSHDSEQVMFFNPSPSRQITLSDIEGKQRQTLLSVSDYLETEFSRIEDSQDIIFSTINLDFNNRWVNHVEEVQEISNSTVYDMKPTLAHTTLNYAFVSTRTGQEQIYYGDLVNGNSRVLSRLKKHRWLKQLSFSPNDKFLLTADLGHVWLMDVGEQLDSEKLINLTPDSAVISTQGTLLTAIWLSNDFLYFKVEQSGKIKGYIYDRNNRHSVEVDNRWQTLLTDHKTADTLYLVDPVDTQLYQMPIEVLSFDKSQTTLKFPERSVVATGTRLPTAYFDLKLHDGKIYYVTSSNSGNSRPYDFQIEVKSVSPKDKQDITIHKTSCSCGYDIADSGFMISELIGIEGDIHRTVR